MKTLSLKNQNGISESLANICDWMGKGVAWGSQYVALLGSTVKNAADLAKKLNRDNKIHYHWTAATIWRNVGTSFSQP